MRYTLILSFLFFALRLHAQPVQFAVIGDYGAAGQPEADVSALVKNWEPEFIVTVGDNNYENGSASTIDRNIGQYYHEYISPYVGSFGRGATENRFFPALGNHDWIAQGARPYLDYFTLPGNERYYDFVRGPVHFFVIDSDPHEPDGNTSASRQALWLKDELAASTSEWNIVYFHHPPYSSGLRHGGSREMRWPFKDWGASVVLTGHEHLYERLEEGGLPYIANGLGGKSLYEFAAPVPGSKVRFNGDYGAMWVKAWKHKIIFRFVTRSDSLVDELELRKHSQIAHRVKIPVKDRINSFPATTVLAQNYPNPFNPSTTFSFTIDHPSLVTLRVYNILGQEMATIVDENLPAGTYTRSWNAGGAPGGMYFYKLTSNGHVFSRIMALLK